MVKIAICDDEAAMCSRLENLLSSMLRQKNEPFRITCYKSGAKLLFSPLDFDLIFLDIQMPHINGMELAGRLRRQNFSGALIFITVLAEHMPDAFEVEAADYLLKPVDESRLKRTLERVLKRLGQKNDKSLFVQAMGLSQRVRIRDICYGEVKNRTIFLHTVNGVVRYYGKIKEVEQQTMPYLIRCHRSFLVNPDYLKEYSGGWVLLENGEQVPVSRQYHPVLMERMMQYMEEG